VILVLAKTSLWLLTRGITPEKLLFTDRTLHFESRPLRISLDRQLTWLSTPYLHFMRFRSQYLSDYCVFSSLLFVFNPTMLKIYASIPVLF
jgi:hypothetical protein